MPLEPKIESDQNNNSAELTNKNGQDEPDSHSRKSNERECRECLSPGSVSIITLSSDDEDEADGENSGSSSEQRRPSRMLNNRLVHEEQQNVDDQDYFNENSVNNQQDDSTSSSMSVAAVAAAAARLLMQQQQNVSGKVKKERLSFDNYGASLIGAGATASQPLNLSLGHEETEEQVSDTVIASDLLDSHSRRRSGLDDFLLLQQQQQQNEDASKETSDQIQRLMMNCAPGGPKSSMESLIKAAFNNSLNAANSSSDLDLNFMSVKQQSLNDQESFRLDQADEIIDNVNGTGNSVSDHVASGVIPPEAALNNIPPSPCQLEAACQLAAAAAAAAAVVAESANNIVDDFVDESILDSMPAIGPARNVQAGQNSQNVNRNRSLADVISSSLAGVSNSASTNNMVANVLSNLAAELGDEMVDLQTKNKLFLQALQQQQQQSNSELEQQQMLMMINAAALAVASTNPASSTAAAGGTSSSANNGSNATDLGDQIDLTHQLAALGGHHFASALSPTSSGLVNDTLLHHHLFGANSLLLSSLVNRNSNNNPNNNANGTTRPRY